MSIAPSYDNQIAADTRAYLTEQEEADRAFAEARQRALSDDETLHDAAERLASDLFTRRGLTTDARIMLRGLLPDANQADREAAETALLAHARKCIEQALDFRAHELT